MYCVARQAVVSPKFSKKQASRVCSLIHEILSAVYKIRAAIKRTQSIKIFQNNVLSCALNMNNATTPCSWTYPNLGITNRGFSVAYAVSVFHNNVKYSLKRKEYTIICEWLGASPKILKHCFLETLETCLILALWHFCRKKPHRNSFNISLKLWPLQRNCEFKPTRQLLQVYWLLYYILTEVVKFQKKEFRGSGDSRVKKVGAHCRAKEKVGGPT